MTIQVSVKIPEELLEELKLLAETEKRTMSNLINKLLSDGVENHRVKKSA